MIAKLLETLMEIFKTLPEEERRGFIVDVSEGFESRGQ